MKHGFIRVGAATPKIKVADCQYNREQILAMMRGAGAKGVEILALPELCLTGSTCGDLFLLPSLAAEARESLDWLAKESAGLNMLAFVGLPVLAAGGRLLNCTAAMCQGRILTLIPKQKLNIAERRWFSQPPENGVMDMQMPFISNPFLYHEQMPGCIVAVGPLNSVACDATVLINPSAEYEQAGGAEKRRAAVAQKSARSVCAVIHAAAGDGESTTDAVFSGHNIIAENGEILAEGRPFENGLVFADIDTEFISSERIKAKDSTDWEILRRPWSGFSVNNDFPLTRKFSPTPFVPADTLARGAEVLAMQSAGLEQRLRHTGVKDLVLGLSGGLDSTLAFLVAVHAFDRLKLSREGICAVSMPCFGTSERTRGNAKKLAEAFGVTFMEIDITASVKQHFRDIGHNNNRRDLVYENAQARERTQLVMDLAAKRHGFVLGTGDMSELALGFATYNGDHMSMYNVNASVPKTLIPHIILAAAEGLPKKTVALLRDIIDTPVSPELLPPDPKTGEAQETEKAVGPYILHDFFLYHMARRGADRDKILYIAAKTFQGKYSEDEIEKWLGVFISRFYANQFKRSCMPDGPRVGSVSLSPRGGWVMGSDVGAKK